MSALWPVQKAIVARLKASVALMAVVTGVFDSLAPEGTAMPYVLVGEPLEDALDAMGKRGYEDSFLIHVWSAQRGTNQQAFEVGALIDTALATALTIESHGTGITRRADRQMLVEDDGTRHLAIRYRFLAFEA